MRSKEKSINILEIIKSLTFKAKYAKIIPKVNLRLERSMNMKKSTKIIISAVAAIAAVSAVAAKFFCDYALKSGKNGFRVDMLPQNTKKEPDEMRDILKERTKEYTEWLKENSEDVFLLTKDGVKVHAVLCKTAKTSRKYVIMCHGYKGNAYNLGFQAYNFNKMGYNVLAIDGRASGRTEGSYIGMGYLEKSDLKGYVNFILARDPQAQIALYGISMGAAEVMMASADGLPQNVKAVIEDSGFTNVWDAFKHQVRETFHILPEPMLFLASAYAKIRLGFDFKQASAVEAVKKTNIPILFIQGTKDSCIPFAMFDTLYKSCASEKEVYVVDGADHMQCDVVDPEKYYQTAERFLNKYIK